MQVTKHKTSSVFAGLSGATLIATVLSLVSVPLGIALAYAMLELPCYLPICYEHIDVRGKRAFQIVLAVFYIWLVICLAVVYAVSF